MRIEDIGRCVLKFDLGYLFNLLINPSCSNIITHPFVNLLPSTICFCSDMAFTHLQILLLLHYVRNKEDAVCKIP